MTHTAKPFPEHRFNEGETATNKYKHYKSLGTTKYQKTMLRETELIAPIWNMGGLPRQ
jgi:hypothetical protein